MPVGEEVREKEGKGSDGGCSPEGEPMLGFFCLEFLSLS